MKILVATWGFPTHGGVFTFLSLLVPHLVSRGHLVDVVSISPSPGSRREFAHLPANRIHNISQLPLPSPLSFPLAHFIVRLISVAREARPDLIFCQDPFYSGIPSCLAARIMGLTLGLADHGMITNFSREEYWKAFGFKAVSFWRVFSYLAMKLVVSGSSFIYSPGDDVSERISELFGKEAASKTCTMPIGIDTEVYRPITEARRKVRSELGLGDETVAVFVGRLHVESGLDYLIEASALLPDDGRPRFVIVGDGTLRGRYERLARGSSPGSFTFTGYRENISEILNAADLFVFPKVFAGGHSVALREAMATGLACIATAGVDSHDRIISVAETGILVPPGDGPALASAIYGLVRDAKARRKMGSLARTSMVQTYGIGSFLGTLERLLQSARAA